MEEQTSILDGKCISPKSLDYIMRLQEKKKKKKSTTKKKKYKRKRGPKKKVGRKPLPKKRGPKPQPKKPGPKPKHKKMGRPKKRGPKPNWYMRRKKRLLAEKKKSEPRVKPLYLKVEKKYKVVKCVRGVQNGVIGKFFTEIDARNKINELLKESENVIFKKEVTHKSTFMKDATYEYVLLEKNKNEGKKNALIRNEYGKEIEHRSSNDLWVIRDKFPYSVEETFMVFGYDGKTDRKTFQWVYENIITGGRTYRYDIKRVFLYKNKVVVKNDGTKLDIIFCKIPSDAVRLYIMASEWVKRDNIGYVFFMGDYGDIQQKERKRKLEKELMKATGYPRWRVQSSSTTQHYKKTRSETTELTDDQDDLTEKEI